MSGHRLPGRRALGAIGAALVAAALAGGCGGPAPRSETASGPTPAGTAKLPSTSGSSSRLPTAGPLGDGLLILSGRPGSMRLELVDGRGRRAVATPDPDVAWISTDPRGRVLATTRDGRAFLSDPMSTGRDRVWSRLRMTGLHAAALPGQLAFGTLDGEGSRAAFLAADFAGGRPSFDVVIAATADGRATRHPVPRPADGSPPIWFGGRLVLLTRERGDAAGVSVLDPAADTLVDGPGPLTEGTRPEPARGWSGPIAALSVAADGSRVAVGVGDGAIEIHPAEPWLTGAETGSAPVGLDAETDESRAYAWLALDRDGRRLAVVRTDADGDARAVEIHRADDWRTDVRIGLPGGATRAVVAWLP